MKTLLYKATGGYKFLAILLTVLLLVGLTPQSVFAGTEPELPEPVIEVAEEESGDIPVVTIEDQDDAAVIDSLIEAIGLVGYTDNSRTLIKAAEDEYNVATSEVKALVDAGNYTVMLQARTDFDALALAATNAAATAIGLISAVDTIELTDAATVAAARSAYDALLSVEKADFDTTQSALVQKLIDSETKLISLAGDADLQAAVDEALTGVLNYLATTINNPAVGNEWSVFAMARGGKIDADSPITKKYLANPDAKLASGNTNFLDSVTDFERLTLALSSIGIVTVNYFPSFSINEVDAFSCFGYAVYAALCFTPHILTVYAGFRWRKCVAAMGSG